MQRCGLPVFCLQERTAGRCVSGSKSSSFTYRFAGVDASTGRAASCQKAASSATGYAAGLLSSRDLGSRADIHFRKLPANFVKISQNFQIFLQISENPSNFLAFPEIPAKFRQNSVKFAAKNSRFGENSAKFWQNLQKISKNAKLNFHKILRIDNGAKECIV